jgi:hypothetical protein
MACHVRRYGLAERTWQAMSLQVEDTKNAPLD